MSTDRQVPAGQQAREAPEAQRLPEQVAVRRSKLQAMRAAGVGLYGAPFRPTHQAAQIVACFDQLAGQDVAVAGRLMALRLHGKVGFADLWDSSGRIQLYLREELVGSEAFSSFFDLDRGDIVGARGEVVKTRRGEVSVEVRSYQPMVKALQPPPEKWHGLKEVELRYRRRYVDLMVHPEVRQIFLRRAAIEQALREFFTAERFVEVETPMLHPVAGGANARPFVTHHNTLDMDLYLRIAPELYLKRLLVGGFDRVFEIGKNFRNEGISTRHNPEHTSLEAYAAYWDYQDMMSLTERCVAYVADRVLGTRKIEYAGRTLDLTPPWPRLSMVEALRRYAGIDLSSNRDAAAARAIAARAGIAVEPDATYGRVVVALFEGLVEEQLWGPIFITDHPVDVSPLARQRPDDPAFTERFEPYLATMEIGNGFSELNDPDEQRRRFEAQAALRARGDQEAHPFDDDFLLALEYGMPPAGGLGIGVDRLTMVLTGAESIREVILFPLLRPEEPGRE
ncbi:lysine--tRNA ligase [Carboxydochorda subterranea]|uniref:Lysine--tRNA ligase n=1 Tax=Carboxydichorda subterranea TaxID=3109565 RepID=A0ABZ1BVS8_9FIRM|nr:lysine--tRNA ligase [Limnochorda sp. L945t]WRP16698.1 lysine--tRNA ligase [Limnochorda sp. L945t]